MSDIDSEKTVLGSGDGEGPFQLNEGSRLGDHIIQKLLGRGAMGEVYLAKHSKLNRLEAVKILPQELVEQRGFVDRFSQEAQALAVLDHPNVVKVYNAGSDHGLYALSMEYVSGGSLDDYLAQKGGKLTIVESCNVLRQVLEGLKYAHSKSVVHRDIKPANVLISEAGKVKISDFGLAQVVGDEYVQTIIQQTIIQRTITATQINSMKTHVEGAGSGSTTGSDFAGTIDYMSPEVRSGQQKADARSDLYAVGIMAYKLLTGRVPVGRYKPVSTLVSGLNRKWDLWLDRLMEPEPSERFASAEEALRQMERIEPRKAQKSRKGIWGVVGIAAVVAIAGVFFWQGRAEHPARPVSSAQENENAEADEVVKGLTLPKEQTPPDSSLINHPSTLTSGLTLSVTPSNSHIWIGDHSNVTLEKGEGTLELPDGTHDLIIQAAGYQAYSKQIEVVNGKASETVSLVPVKGILQIEADAGTSIVAIDAEGNRTDLGKTDFKGGLSIMNVLNIGVYDLELSKPKHETAYLNDVELIIGKAVKREVDLKPLPGKLSIFTTPVGADVYINGEKQSKQTSDTFTDLPSETLLQVEVRKRGYRTESERFTLEAEGSENWMVGTLTAQAGGVALKVEVGGVKVEVDGEVVELGINNEGLGIIEGLEPGSRTLRVTHEDYEPWEKRVTVVDDEIVDVSVNLTPKPGFIVFDFKTSDGGGVSNVAFVANGKRIDVKNNKAEVESKKLLNMGITVDGYEDWSGQLIVEPNQTLNYQVKLEEIIGPKAGSDWTLDLGGVDLVMKYIRPGSFQMGSPSSEKGRYDSEKQHRVTLSKGCWLGQYEVTQAQWQALMGNNPSHFINAGKQSPVESVSWNDAMEFCKKLTQRERAAGRLPQGYEYILPTEAQWEYACRAPSASSGQAGTKYCYGNDEGFLSDYGWYSSNSGNKSHPVGQKRANAWGLYDMHGNVWEWCSDWYGDYSSGSVTDPTGASSGSFRVFRGGSWLDLASYCRSALRSGNGPARTDSYLGFRVALLAER